MKQRLIGLMVLIVGGLGLVVGTVGVRVRAEGGRENGDAMVQQQNQIMTQNEGEDSELQVSNQEKEREQGEENEGGVGEDDEMVQKGSTRSATAREHMSEVATRVELLFSERIEKEGIGEEVRLVAQEQQRAQEEIRVELGKIESRGKLTKSLLGPDYKALENMRKQLEQNQMRIQQLEELKNQLTNEGEVVAVEETIQALVEQNTSLEDRLLLEEQTKSLLGWLMKLFVN